MNIQVKRGRQKNKGQFLITLAVGFDSDNPEETQAATEAALEMVRKHTTPAQYQSILSELHDQLQAKLKQFQNTPVSEGG